MTNNAGTQPALGLRFVRGDSNAVSTGGLQFQLWPPRRFMLIVSAISILFLTVTYLLTLGRLTDYRLELSRQQTQLDSYRVKVMELETNLIKAQEMVSKVARLAGVEFEFNPISTIRDTVSRRIATSAATLGSPGDLTIPFGLPLKGYVTQWYMDNESGDPKHPGIDMAVAEGSPVLATASGVIRFAGTDPIYGLTVIIQHNDTLSALYGHNSKLLVTQGAPVMAGGRIALSGNTGKSSAPHLHYEIRAHGKPIDPEPFLGGAGVSPNSKFLED